MKKTFFGVFMVCLLALAVAGQHSAPPGESKFIRSMLNGELYKLREKIAQGKFDEVEGGFGAPDWTAINGRVFITSRQMEEVGKIEHGYSTFDYEKALAESFKKSLTAEGFKMKTSGDRLYAIQYQRGSTVGFIDVRSFFLENGFYRMEFIFYESYLTRRTHKAHIVNARSPSRGTVDK
ncbi:MAG: hypothetical protein ABI999_03275 [Acidobacteriota bacterium]